MEIVHAQTLDDALSALAANPESELLAGGTDFMVEVNFHQRHPRRVIALRRVDELRHWDGRAIGANVTYADMERGSVAALAEAARTVGSPQIRAAGTLGGNLGTASPAGDTLPVLAALDATIELQSASGRRSVPWDEFIIGVKQTSRRPDEIIVGVTLPAEMPQRQAFAKIGVRSAMVISMVSACAMRWADGRISLAMGAVAPTPVRMGRAEELLAADNGPRDALFSELAAIVFTDVRPITDQRGTEAYRRHAAGVLARRVVERVLT